LNLRFPYIPRQVDPLPGEEGPQVIYEPIALVRCVGPTRTYLIQGLVDTGASMTLLPHHYAARLGVALTARGQLRTAGGMLPARFGELDIEVGSGRVVHRWRARVGFVPRADNLAILGHDGFLDLFRVTFDGPARVLTLSVSDGPTRGR
jgi:hypothetical protein